FLTKSFAMVVHLMWYHEHLHDDQIATNGGSGSVTPHGRDAARLLVPLLPPGLHAAATVRAAGLEDVLQDRLPRRRPAARSFRRTACRSRLGKRPAILHSLLRRPAAEKKGDFVLLPAKAPRRAKGGGLIENKPEAAIDPPGLENRHTSCYFFKRARPKLS